MPQRPALIILLVASLAACGDDPLEHADDVPNISSFDDGFIFLDLFSDEPGVRALPRP